MKGVLLIIAVLFFASAGRTGEVWKWVDEQGVVHFTDNADLVAEKHKENIDRMELPEEKGAVSGNDKETKEGMEEPRDRYGRGEDYWTKRANEIREQLEQAQKEYERVRLEYNDLVAEYNSTRSRAKKRQYQKRIESLQDQLHHQREDIDRSKELLEKTLAEEAERAGAPVEWVK
jgi:chromosome segregation ATPase